MTQSTRPPWIACTPYNSLHWRGAGPTCGPEKEAYQINDVGHTYTQPPCFVTSFQQRRLVGVQDDPRKEPNGLDEAFATECCNARVSKFIGHSS